MGRDISGSSNMGKRATSKTGPPTTSLSPIWVAPADASANAVQRQVPGARRSPSQPSSRVPGLLPVLFSFDMATVLSSPHSSVVLDNVSWKTYVSLVEDFSDNSAPRLTYDRGKLEIMSPTKEHERLNRVLAQLVEILTAELGIDMENLGSTTFKREDLGRGFEPDSCFYFKHAELVRSREELDLSIDPAPELVIEIDITSPSVVKDPIYARLGVAEVWRFDGAELRILALEGDQYVASERSLALPPLTASVLTRFVKESRDTSRPKLVAAFRGWLQSALREPS